MWGNLPAPAVPLSLYLDCANQPTWGVSMFTLVDVEAYHWSLSGYREPGNVYSRLMVLLMLDPAASGKSY